MKIIKPIKKEKCTLISQEGDVVEQFYRLSDKDGKELGSNFGKKPSVSSTFSTKWALRRLFG